jgi:hypothetical protein
MNLVLRIVCLASIGVTFGSLECGAQVSPLPGAPPGPASPSAPNNPSDAGAIAKSLGADALRLLDETVRGVGRLEELQKNLDANLANTANAKNLVDQLLGLLRDTASRLVRDLASVQGQTAIQRFAVSHAHSKATPTRLLKSAGKRSKPELNL